MTTELLLPAGNLEKMRAAYAYGADAVYAGLPRYSLRARNNEFRQEQLAAGMAEARALGKKFYITCNILPHDDKVRSFVRQLQPLIELQPDALIMADPGLIMLAREAWPDLAIHLSVQANTLNQAAVRFWQGLGLRRIILSRELSLHEIGGIRQACPDIELEVFVHGALCIAYSGRCLLSGYFNRRDPNQGTCTNACRWDYKVHAGEEDASALSGFSWQSELEQPLQAMERHPLADRIYLIEERERPGELMPIEEDEHGTYIMNSRDLRAVEQVAALVALGVNSLKIEGRTKSLYYVARTAQIYRQALDDAQAGRPFDARLLSELDGLAHRGYTTGFLERQRSDATQNYATGSSQQGHSQFVGQVLSQHEGWALVDVKNRFAIGDTLLIIHPQGNRELRLEQMHDEQGAPVQVAAGNGHKVRIPLDAADTRTLLARRA